MSLDLDKLLWINPEIEFFSGECNYTQITFDTGSYRHLLILYPESVHFSSHHSEDGIMDSGNLNYGKWLFKNDLVNGENIPFDFLFDLLSRYANKSEYVSFTYYTPKQDYHERK